MIRKRSSLAISLALAFASLLLAAEAHTQAINPKIDPRVLTELQQQGTASFFVVLNEQADVSRATAITDWNVRGQTVVDSLKGAADRAQRPILDFLANTNAEVTPFWIVNTIKVTTDDEQLIQLLAALPDVLRLRQMRRGRYLSRCQVLMSPQFRQLSGAWRAYMRQRSGISSACGARGLSSRTSTPACSLTIRRSLCSTVAGWATVLSTTTTIGTIHPASVGIPLWCHATTMATVATPWGQPSVTMARQIKSEWRRAPDGLPLRDARRIVALRQPCFPRDSGCLRRLT